jgi:hypothetical protein
VNLNILIGLNEDVSPASFAHRDGALAVCKQMRVDKDGLWSKVAQSNVSANDLSSVVADDGVTQTTANIVSGIAANGSVSVSTSGSLTGSRMESGLYFYMATTATSGSEGVTSKAVEYYVGRHFSGNDVRAYDVPVITASGSTPRIYRTKVIYAQKGSKIQRVQQNSPTEFFYVGSGTTVYDYLHDSELGYKYEGRGSVLSSTPAVIARFDGRIFAFYTGYARWSSVGRPREFPQAHNVSYYYNYSNSTWNAGDFKEGLAYSLDGSPKTITFYPTLENGVHAETRLWLPEIIDRAVVAALEFKGKLWVWTATTVGYIVPSGAGYRYIHLSEDFGATAGTIVEGGVYLFGADSNGAWILDGEFPKKISDGIISPTINRGNWNSTYEEYWFGTASIQYIYNTKLGTITSKVGSYTPEMIFWAQANDGKVKEDVRITILLKSGACTATVYQGYYPDTSDCVSSGNYSISDGTHITVIEPINSGRYIGIKLVGTTFELAGINIEAKDVNEFERNYR